MSKFKVGDKVIRVQDRADILGVGYIGTVTCVSQFGHIEVDDHPYGYFHYKNFEHYVEQPTVDSTAVLTPIKVFEYILAGTPLEYKVSTSTNAFEWADVQNPDCITAQHTRIAQYRVKPQTVKVNGIDVPKPVKLPTGTWVWYPSVGCNVVQGGRVSNSLRTYWATKEDAQAVLDAILTSFSK